MKTWVIVLLVVVALLLLGIREGFEATATIKDPDTWDTAEYSRIRTMVTPASTASDTDIKEIVGGFFPTWRGATSRITLSQVTSYISSKNVAPDKRAEYTEMVKAYYIDQGQSVFQQAAGYVASYAAVGGATQDPIEEARRAREAGTTTGTTGGTAATSSGTTTGNTTGGASTSSFGPNSGSGTGGPVWGPAFTSFGSLLGGSTGDSTQTTQYPTLLGGLGNASTRLDGAGITQPSSSWQLSLSGQLPSMGSLGANADSQFLPYSRTPGDQDIIPDPFRVSQQFSAASYSSRQEPAPFLTDFSAFLA